MGGKASGVTTSLVSFVVGAGRARDLPAIIDQLVSALRPRSSSPSPRCAPRSRSPKIKRPASPKPSNKATGKKVQLHVVIDPSVMGGLVASVGDTVIDGTVRERLDQLKSLL